MEVLWSVVVGLLVCFGIFLMLERHLLRVLFGVILLSSAINIAIFTAGRLTKGEPPLVAIDALVPPADAANPLPQALILTAIVIGFGLMVFALLLFYRAFSEANSADVDQLTRSEEDQ